MTSRVSMGTTRMRLTPSSTRNPAVMKTTASGPADAVGAGDRLDEHVPPRAQPADAVADGQVGVQERRGRSGPSSSTGALLRKRCRQRAPE